MLVGIDCRNRAPKKSDSGHGSVSAMAVDVLTCDVQTPLRNHKMGVGTEIER